MNHPFLPRVLRSVDYETPPVRKATIGDNHCCALYTPARDQHGRIDPDQRTAALLDLYQATTAAEIADLLTS